MSTHSSNYIRLASGEVVLVDQEDFAELSKFKWHAHNHGYAQRCDGRNKKIKMHRQILGQDCEGKLVDHINGSGFDNRRSNLRVVDFLGNSRNRGLTKGKRYKGVVPRNQKYEASITHNWTKVYLGVFPTEEDAARAYDEAARRLHGEHARLNFWERAMSEDQRAGAAVDSAVAGQAASVTTGPTLVERLRAELAEARKDADRWRFWRKSYKNMRPVPSIVLGRDDGDQLDDCVDAAMRAAQTDEK